MMVDSRRVVTADSLEQFMLLNDRLRVTPDLRKKPRDTEKAGLVAGMTGDRRERHPSGGSTPESHTTLS